MEKSDLYDFYGVLYSDKTTKTSFKFIFFLANADSGETVDKQSFQSCSIQLQITIPLLFIQRPL